MTPAEAYFKLGKLRSFMDRNLKIVSEQLVGNNTLTNIDNNLETFEENLVKSLTLIRELRGTTGLILEIKNND